MCIRDSSFRSMTEHLSYIEVEWLYAVSLLEAEVSISEISFMVGMNSVAYFRRCFKAEYGEIPSEYLP